ncbi:MAG TPA: glycosyltransferase family 2 protein, partial [Planctomycetaceae bacterium]|nr:glycosyltransferase family 2 protein [Planctomycetaceae bacterium]
MDETEFASDDSFTRPADASDAITVPGSAGGLLSVIVPAYNEERTIDEILRRILAVPLVSQVIVVDDASSDGTAGCLDVWRAHPLMTVVTHPRNRGKGAAIRTGLVAATAEYVIIQDADLEYDPEDYPALMDPLLNQRADVVYGTRQPAIKAAGYRGRLIATGGIATIN